MSMELVTRTPTVPANEWLLISKQADMLAMSDIIPVAYRRKPANIVVAALTGRTHGWDVLTAMRNGHVIEGQWGMKPEAMLGLVRAAGHHVDIELIEDGPIPERGAVVTAHREGEAPMVVRFTIAMAADKGLVQLKDGKPWARSSTGKRLPWELYPVDMCMWRAVGKACRAKYSDITLGIYSTEELGAIVDAEGEIVEAEVVDRGPTEPTPLSPEALEKFMEACGTEGITAGDVLVKAFGDDVPDPLTDEHLPAMRDAFRLVVEASLHHDVIEGGGEGAGDSSSTDPDSVRPATKAMVGKIKGEYERLGVIDRDRQLASTAGVIGRQVSTHNDLTIDEAGMVLDHLAGL